MSTQAPGGSNKLHASTGLPALLTISQVAEATGQSTKTIRRRIADGTLLMSERIPGPAGQALEAALAIGV